MARFVCIIVAIFAATTFAFAATMGAWGPNSTVSMRSASYLGWASKNLPFSGGLIFGKGKVNIVVTDGEEFAEISAQEVGVQVRHGGEVTLTINDNEQDFVFRFQAHDFAICPMAQHVAEDRALAYTVPPYIDEQYFQELALVSYGGGYIAKEFLSNDRIGRLVFDADFWPDHDMLSETEMDKSVREAILADVNRINVFAPDPSAYNIGFTYFSGDFHVDAVIELRKRDMRVYFHGTPITYHPSRTENGRIEISDVHFLDWQESMDLSSNPPYEPKDFKSLFELSYLFTAMRNAAGDNLSAFIKTHC